MTEGEPRGRAFCEKREHGKTVVMMSQEMCDCRWRDRWPGARVDAARDRRSLHRVRERSELKPLGVGINLQPIAVRELEDLGIGEPHSTRSVSRRVEWALVG